MTCLDRVDSQRLDTWWSETAESAPFDPSPGAWSMSCPGACEVEGVCVMTKHGTLASGGVDSPFTLMSAVKPFLLWRSLELHGPARVASWIDRQASDLPYYSLAQLQQDRGRPRNAMLNSGAMVLASHLPGRSPEEQAEGFRAWLCHQTSSSTLALDCDQACLAQTLDRQTDPTNWGLAVTLERFGAVTDAARAHHAYFRLCALRASVRETAELGCAIAHSESPETDIVLDTMRIAGLYEASADWWHRTRLAAKTAVSGMMFGVVPRGGCIAAASRWLDASGNPRRPQKVLARVAAA